MWNPEQRSPVILLVATHWTMRMAVRAERAGEGPCSVAPPSRPPQCTPRHCPSRNSTPLLSSTWLPGSRPTQRPTLGGSWLGQGWARNPTRANRSYLWESELDIKQEELLFLCVPCSLKKTVYRGGGKTDGQQQSPETRAQECSRGPAAFLTLVCGTPCVASFCLSYFELGFCIFQTKESWLKQQQRDSI